LETLVRFTLVTKFSWVLANLRSIRFENAQFDSTILGGMIFNLKPIQDIFLRVIKKS